MFSKMMFLGPRYVINSSKTKNEHSDKHNVNEKENVDDKSGENKEEL